MKILLAAINSKYIHSNPAVYSLKASSLDYSSYIKIREFTINNLKEEILSEIYKERPDVLCFSVYIWNVEYVNAISREFSKLCPDIPIWTGGPEVSYECEDYLINHSWIKGIVIGEGEETFKEICRCYVNHDESDLFNVKGLAIRNGEKIIFTGIRDNLDLNTLPFAYNEETDFENRIIYYESSRGCPFSCSYCLSSIEKKLRFKDFLKVKEELKFFLDRKVPQVKFVDRTFNCDHKHAMSIWQFIYENDNGITNFHFEISADLLNEDELSLLSKMRPGLVQLEIGVQTVNPDTVKEIHRSMNLDKLKENVKRIQAGGNIHEHLDLIAGLPYENPESFKRSFDEIYALKAEQLQLGFLKVLKGSYMYEHKDEYGLIYNDTPPYEVMSTKWLSFDDVLALKRVEEMLEVYYNSGQFVTTMKLLETGYPSAYEMYEKLGKFYEENGFTGISHSRIKRYEILNDFIEQENFSETEKEALKEAMVFDVYERENAKTRPSFADDYSKWKDVSGKVVKNGKLSHVERFNYIFPKRSERTIKAIPERTALPVYCLFDYERKEIRYIEP